MTISNYVEAKKKIRKDIIARNLEPEYHCSKETKLKLMNEGFCFEERVTGKGNKLVLQMYLTNPRRNSEAERLLLKFV